MNSDSTSSSYETDNINRALDADWEDDVSTASEESDGTLTGIRQPTNRAPLLSGLRRDMLVALESYQGSYLGICVMLSRLADDLETNKSFIPAAQTVDDLRHAKSAYLLLHAIPPNLLASIIRGTVAYDFLRGGKKPHQYSKKTGGTYVAALSISGRAGKFLSGSEIRTLASLIDKYIEAYDDFARNGFRWDESSRDSQARKQFVAAVDNVYGKPERDASPRFVRKPANRQSTKALAEMFRKRERAAGDPEKQQIQSPLMVGCNGASKNLIEDRVAAHYPQSGLEATTRTWALTLCLLGYMNLVPVVTTVAALPTWGPDDLPLSERLVTTLALSLVTQDGFNVDQPGNHRDGRSLDSLRSSRQMVMAARPWFRNALEASVRHIQGERENTNALSLLADRGPKHHVLTELEETKRMGMELQSLYNTAARTGDELESRTSGTWQQQAESSDMCEGFGNIVAGLEAISLALADK